MSYTTSPMTTPGWQTTMKRKRGESPVERDRWTRVLINDLLRLHPEAEESDLMASLTGARNMRSVQV